MPIRVTTGGAPRGRRLPDRTLSWTCRYPLDGEHALGGVVLVLVALVRVVHVAGLAMVLVLVTLVNVVHMADVTTTLMVVVLVVVALVGIVDVTRAAVVLVLVALVDVVCHAKLLSMNS